MISTWNHGMQANDAGMAVGGQGGSALDMVEAGARLVESDASGQSVGLGGLPDRDGHVTLDACIMDHTLNAGSVCFVQGIEHPITLARRVMEDTPHVMLAGAGAEQYADELGMPRTNLLTPDSEAAYRAWRETSKYAPVINIENHDTISLLASDSSGRLAGACTTSGLAYKMHGRVGDSPIIGAGLYVDGEVGAAAATGLGEAVMRTLGSFLVVELMRGGMTPQGAAEEAIGRIMERMDTSDLQVGYIALSQDGSVGGHAIHPHFSYAVHRMRNAIGAVTSELVESSHA
jgi:isoaspartyl peptidase/L-asparaginase-like protein (Ntn-hydrolase superfamily)